MEWNWADKIRLAQNGKQFSNEETFSQKCLMFVNGVDESDSIDGIMVNKCDFFCCIELIRQDSPRLLNETHRRQIAFPHVRLCQNPNGLVLTYRPTGTHPPIYRWGTPSRISGTVDKECGESLETVSLYVVCCIQSSTIHVPKYSTGRQIVCFSTHAFLKSFVEKIHKTSILN